MNFEKTTFFVLSFFFLEFGREIIYVAHRISKIMTIMMLIFLLGEAKSMIIMMVDGS